VFWGASQSIVLPPALAQDSIHRFERIMLTDVYYSEGANAADFNNDGQIDAVYGPLWFAGPDFQQRHEIYPPKPQPREAYADNFFSWPYDFNGDGWTDVLVVGFPGTPAYVYENPTKPAATEHWTKHEVFDWVSNESPHFTNLVGDPRPELVCTRDGYYGYATFDPEQPWQAWTFHTISEQVATPRFGHGLGVGDVNGDGRLDVIASNGWFAQPEDLAAPRWMFHPYNFTERGGAEMHVYDVDGDGDNDVITSLAAHEFGLAWFEQFRDGDQIQFRQHLIMGDRLTDNRYGLVFSELHSVALHDMDGDGLRDIVTGKTYWSHHTQSPMWDAGAVVYWFRLVRGAEGIDWVPYRADEDAGIGRQVSIVDVNLDQLPDIVVGGMKGAHVLIHRRQDVSDEEYLAAQPQPIQPPAEPDPAFQRGPDAPLDATTGRVEGALEGESLNVVEVSQGQIHHQAMQGFRQGKWSGNQQMFWTGGQPGAKLTLGLDVEQAGSYQLEAVLTRAPDYGRIQLLLNNQPLEPTLDLYHYPEVTTTGVLTFGIHNLTVGQHRLTIEIKGSNPASAQKYFVGLDYVRLVKVEP
jgi:hypothetical protein